jgi:hypothetical protein
MGKFVFFILILSVFFVVRSAHCEPLSQLAIFSRCYTHITQQRLNLSHPMRAEVVNGSKSAAEACMTLLKSASLRNPEGRLITDTPETRAILSTFNDFHRSWFPNDRFDLSLPGGAGLEKTRLLHDSAESALHVTRILLTENIPYSQLVTLPETVEALRSRGPASEAQVPDADRLKHGVTPAGEYGTPAVNINTELVQEGELLGISLMSRNPVKNGLVLNGNRVVNIPGTGNINYPTGTVLPNQSFGGGILGTPSYLLLNMGRSDSIPADGGIHMPRRWAQAVYKDLLCRQIPVVRAKDALPYVNKSPGPNSPPFRSGPSCMRCHTSMDMMAATARNQSYHGIPLNGAIGTMHLTGWPATLPRESGLVDADPFFFQRPPQGRLFFRSFNGTLVNQDVLGLAQLGSEISNLDDFYACAASRYFHYFTGVQVSLQDIGDPDLAVLTPTEKYYRDRVIKLGQDLKQHQNLLSLIQAILTSDMYSDSTRRAP